MTRPYSSAHPRRSNAQNEGAVLREHDAGPLAGLAGHVNCRQRFRGPNSPKERDDSVEGTEGEAMTEKLTRRHFAGAVTTAVGAALLETRFGAFAEASLPLGLSEKD